ncbi:hypothetical protein Salmuc_00663 [Salipiger mucosus DSM 16094]|uniref:Hemin uptake protein n=2 Tax=Salipiger mucosus TaxID=263378 RepID=S9S4G9_9RHOB|nr:hypothetical protein Salmuc_00663 [Salipiger mucosus DSM 16094]
MTRDRIAGHAPAHDRPQDDMLALFFGGFWPADARLEALLDRIETRGADHMMEARFNADTARPAVPRHDARELTHGGVTAEIELDGQLYTLRITKAGKLILTK